MDLSVVVPCFNEEKNISLFYNEINDVLKHLNLKFELIFINDGSTDNTSEEIRKLTQVDQKVKGVFLSRNFGHQSALVAGINYCKGDLTVMMDADMQHPPSLIPTLIEKQKEGFDVVNTTRKTTQDSTFIKNATSKGFYKLINRLSDIEIKEGSADFRLLNRKALEAYKSFTEKTRFTRGLVSWMGFKVAYIPYNANKRANGESKYSFKHMLKFARNGITSFSSKPLRIPMYLGVFSIIIALIYSTYIFYQYYNGTIIKGWPSTLITILFLGGAQMLSIGIIGEYIAKIYEESKNRPIYFIDELINVDSENLK